MSQSSSMASALRAAGLQSRYTVRERILSSTGLNLIERELTAAQQKLKDLVDARNSMQAQVDEYNAQIEQHERGVVDLQGDWEHLKARLAAMEPSPPADPVMPDLPAPNPAT